MYEKYTTFGMLIQSSKKDVGTTREEGLLPDVNTLFNTIQPADQCQILVSRK